VITASQLRLADALREIGATALEQAEVLLAVTEADALIIDLSEPAWMHERRGKGGKWTGDSTASAVADRLKAESRRDDAVRKSLRANTRKQVATALRPDTPMTQEEARVAKAAGGEGMTPAHHEVAKMITEVRQTHEKYVQDSDTEEGKKARTKTMAVVASLLGGAILGGIESKLGVSDLVAIASSIGPAIIESLFEWWKRL
jgi:hypothetical protein